MAWQDKPEVKKGSIGERIVNEILSSLDYMVYRPITEGSHKVDFFAHKMGSEKNVIAVEAKAKKRMAKYNSTGFNYSNYLHYAELMSKYNIDTYVYFIDDFEGGVYGAWLSELGVGFRSNTPDADVMLWPLSKMTMIRKLTEQECIEISQYTKEKYSYAYTVRYFNWDNNPKYSIVQ